MRIPVSVRGDNRRKSEGEHETQKNDILWQVLQLHFSIVVVLFGGGLGTLLGGRVRYAMYFVRPQWQEPL